MENKFYLKLLSSLYISTFFIRTSFGIMLSTLPIYLGIREEFTSYGIVAAASPLFEMGTVLFTGTVVDKHGRKKVLLAGLMIATVFLFLISSTKNLFAILFINAFHGIAAGAILVSSLALLADYAPERKRGKEIGAFDAFNLLGWVAGYALGVLFIEFLGNTLWLSFIIAGVMTAFGFVYSYVNVTEPKKDEFISVNLRFNTIFSVLKQRSILLLTIPWFIVFMLIGAIMTFFTISTSQGALEINPLVISVGILIGGLILLSTQVFFGKLSDKYGRLPIMMVGTLGFVGIMIVVGFGYVLSPTNNNENIRESILHFWPLLGILGFMALAFGPSSLSSLADEAQKQPKGVIMAVYSIVISAGMFIGIPTVAAISDRYDKFGVLAFMIGCAVAMLCFVLVRYLDVKKTTLRVN